MTLSEIIYHDVNESFGMGGPYIGKLEFHGEMIEGEFLADNEKLSNDKSRLVFSKYNGTKKTGFFGLKSIRDFKILIYDELTNSWYESKQSFEALAIENMVENIITFHIAFHTEFAKFRRQVGFNLQNFIEINKPNNQQFYFDENFTKIIVEELECRLNRNLTELEMNAFKRKRSGIAYEMILDHIKSNDLTPEELENYVTQIVKE